MDRRMEKEALADGVRGLAVLNIEALRAEWRRRFKAPPPALRGPDLMLRALADRIQAEALVGIWTSRRRSGPWSGPTAAARRQRRRDRRSDQGPCWCASIKARPSGVEVLEERLNPESAA
jgi:hypothetical protein